MPSAELVQQDYGMGARGAARSSTGQMLCGEQRSWTFLRASARLTRCQGAFRENLTADRPRLIIILEEVGGRVLISGEGNERGPDSRARGSHMSVIPAGMRAWQYSERVSMFRELVVEFKPTHILEKVDEGFDPAALVVPRMMFCDSNLLRIAELMDSECQPGRPPDVLYGDSLSVALLVGLSRLGRVSAAKIPRGGLVPWQLKRALEYLESHLCEQVSVKSLADLAQLSRSHFSRAFKASAGMTPQRWLRNAKVRRVQQLIVETGWPLAQIAVETGFADQAHLARVFRQVTGENPGAWRRKRLQPKA